MGIFEEFETEFVNDESIKKLKNVSKEVKQLFKAAFNVDELEIRSWQQEALCAETDPEAFYPERGGSTRDAKMICALCSVRETCLETALKNNEHYGIWGGMSERERREILKNREVEYKLKRNKEVKFG